MRTKKWKEIAEAIGVTAIVASLVFVGLQIRQDDEIARLELIDRSTEQQRDLQVWISENSDVWIRGCAGSELDDVEQAIFQRIVDIYISQTYNRWVVRFALTEQTGGGDQYLIDAYAANVHRYPGFRAAYDARRSWAAEGRRYNDYYAEDFRQAFESRLAELAEIDPDPDWDLRHCGT
jgi:hypothetical protein